MARTVEISAENSFVRKENEFSSTMKKTEITVEYSTVHIDNIICLTREPLRCYANRRTIRKEVGAMVTYSDLFTFVIMLCAVVTLVINLMHKK